MQVFLDFLMVLKYIFFRIIVFDKGKIVEFDTPNKLLKNKTSVFYSMAKAADII